MENVRVLKNYKEMTNDELIKDIDEKLDYLMDCYDGVLTQQEILHIQSLNMKELLNAMLENQKDMKNTLNKLIEGWNK